MALLRVSSKALGKEVDLASAIGRGDGAVPQGAALIRFAAAASRGDDDLPEARKEVEEAVGSEGFVLAALTVGIFNGLVRIADSIGIPLDAGMVGASAAFRGELGLDAFSGAQNTDLAGSDRDGFPEGIPELFAG